MFKNIKNYPQNSQNKSVKFPQKKRQTPQVPKSHAIESARTHLTDHVIDWSLKSSLKLLKFWTLKQDMLEISRKRMLQVEIPPNSPKMRCGYGEAATQRSARPKNGGPVLMDEVQVGGPRGTWVLVLRPQCSRVTCHQCGAVDDEFLLELR